MTQKSTLLQVGLAIGGLAGLAFFLKNYLFSQKSKADDHLADPPLSIEKTRQLMQQIKYQMLVVCVNYSEKMSNEMLMFIPQQQMQLAKEKLREAMLKNYQNKQRVILQKHVVSTDDYASSLLAYESDPFLAKNKTEIFLMMEKAINGQSPIMDVPPAALTVNSIDQMKEIYQQMCLMVGKVVWKKMYEQSKNDPTFDPNNDDHFKRSIREINIYQLKQQYLEQKGYLKEWGCPNEIFLKATEHHILKNPNFKFQIRTIEKAYNKLIDIVSNSPLSLSEADVQYVFVNEIAMIAEQQQSKKQKRQVLRTRKEPGSIEKQTQQDIEQRKSLSKPNAVEDFEASGQKKQEVGE